MTTLDQAIDTVLELPPQQQEMLLEIIYRRQVEARRQAIAQDAQLSFVAHLNPSDVCQELQDRLVLRSVSELAYDCCHRRPYFFRVYAR